MELGKVGVVCLCTSGEEMTPAIHNSVLQSTRNTTNMEKMSTTDLDIIPTVCICVVILK